MKSRTRSRKPASIGSNHSSRRPTAISPSEPRTGNFVLLLVMAWSPPAHNAGSFGFQHPETTPPSIPTTLRTAPVFITTVTDRIIGIALEQYVREVPAHPQIERIVQKEIGQEGADDPALRRPSLSPDEAPIRHLHRGFQPSVDV